MLTHFLQIFPLFSSCAGLVLIFQIDSLMLASAADVDINYYIF